MRKLRKMSYFVLALLAILTVGAVVMGCQSCKGATKGANDLRNSKDVPPTIADAKLLSYKYSLSGTMRYPRYIENVEICKDDSSRCIIRLFDEAHSTPENFDAEGELLPDTLIAGSEVLDTIKQMIIEAKAWRFKEDYSPRASVMDGNSWGYSAVFAATDSMLAATPEAQRPRLLRNGGQILTSGGSNASPDTQLFDQVRLYLHRLYQSENKK